MELTSDPTEFEGVLRPGDVLAFDSLRMLSGLVQWADNAPTNHVGIIDDEGALVMANKTRPSETDPDPQVIAAWQVRRILDDPAIHGMTALRPNLDGDASRRVQDMIRAFRRDQAAFGYLDLGLLALPALLRSYDKGDPADPPPSIVERIVMTTRLLAPWALRLVGRDRWTLTCSEFVHRCLVEAGVEVEVRDPLGRTLGVDARWSPDVLAAQQEIFNAINQHNVLAGATARALAPWAEKAPGAGEDVRPDYVTPGDLWRSTSLDPVIALQKPPPR